MKKFTIIIIGAVAILAMIQTVFFSCRKVIVPKDVDSIYIKGIDEISKDSFLKIKDSLIYYKGEYEEDSCWMTKDYYRWNYVYPDTLMVAFTRNGNFEDSVEAIKWDMQEDSIRHIRIPIYVVRDVVGNTWEYDINGKFIEFSCGSRPHSGQPCHYEP